MSAGTLCSPDPADTETDFLAHNSVGEVDPDPKSLIIHRSHRRFEVQGPAWIGVCELDDATYEKETRYASLVAFVSCLVPALEKDGRTAIRSVVRLYVMVTNDTVMGM